MDTNTLGKRKKSSPVGAIRRSQRPRKTVTFLDNMSDKDEEEEKNFNKKVKRKETKKKDAPKSDYEKTRDNNIKEREDLFEKLNIRKDRDDMKKK